MALLCDNLRKMWRIWPRRSVRQGFTLGGRKLLRNFIQSYLLWGSENARYNAQKHTLCFFNMNASIPLYSSSNLISSLESFDCFRFFWGVAAVTAVAAAGLQPEFDSPAKNLSFVLPSTTLGSLFSEASSAKRLRETLATFLSAGVR